MGNDESLAKEYVRRLRELYDAGLVSDEEVMMQDFSNNEHVKKLAQEIAERMRQERWNKCDR